MGDTKRTEALHVEPVYGVSGFTHLSDSFADFAVLNSYLISLVWIIKL